MPAAVDNARNSSATHRFAVRRYALLALMFRLQQWQAAQIEALMAAVSTLRDRLDAAGEAPEPKPPLALH